jgi:hypothetical protein
VPVNNLRAKSLNQFEFLTPLRKSDHAKAAEGCEIVNNHQAQEDLVEAIMDVGA